ncbi:hypothetical protein [Halomonas cerina]|uniref:Dolichol kinase n=1 Tax=Halomonas cerina TaxID=447424 RepID=A0A839V6W9_9GAMM|nr:hypothetical protein [Halomonas cerina]MBB3189545.1 dolichol kinase [Halomonas cerina]
MRLTLLTIAALSLVVWLFYYGYAPLSTEETVVVVLACSVLVLAGRWAGRWLRRLWQRVRHGR